MLEMYIEIKKTKREKCVYKLSKDTLENVCFW